MIKDVEPLLKECEETLKELKEMGNMEVACYVQGFINSINKLPDAEQRQLGEWVVRFGNTFITCNKCGYMKGTAGPYFRTHFEPLPNFCENCGARMVIKNDL